MESSKRKRNRPRRPTDLHIGQRRLHIDYPLSSDDDTADQEPPTPAHVHEAQQPVNVMTDSPMQSRPQEASNLLERSDEPSSKQPIGVLQSSDVILPGLPESSGDTLSSGSPSMTAAEKERVLAKYREMKNRPKMPPPSPINFQEYLERQKYDKHWDDLRAGRLDWQWQGYDHNGELIPMNQPDDVTAPITENGPPDDLTESAHGYPLNSTPVLEPDHHLTLANCEHGRSRTREGFDLSPIRGEGSMHKHNMSDIVGTDPVSQDLPTPDRVSTAGANATFVVRVHTPDMTMTNVVDDMPSTDDGRDDSRNVGDSWPDDHANSDPVNDIYQQDPSDDNLQSGNDQQAADSFLASLSEGAADSLDADGLVSLSDGASDSQEADADDSAASSLWSVHTAVAPRVLRPRIQPPQPPQQQPLNLAAALGVPMIPLPHSVVTSYLSEVVPNFRMHDGSTRMLLIDDIESLMETISERLARWLPLIGKKLPVGEHLKSNEAYLSRYYSTNAATTGTSFATDLNTLAPVTLDRSVWIALAKRRHPQWGNKFGASLLGPANRMIYDLYQYTVTMLQHRHGPQPTYTEAQWKYALNKMRCDCVLGGDTTLL